MKFFFFFFFLRKYNNATPADKHHDARRETTARRLHRYRIRYLELYHCYHWKGTLLHDHHSIGIDQQGREGVMGVSFFWSSRLKNERVVGILLITIGQDEL
jgi:hypothetical protein